MTPHNENLEDVPTVLVALPSDDDYTAPSLMLTLELDLPESTELTRIHRLDFFETSKQAEAAARAILATVASVVDKHKGGAK